MNCVAGLCQFICTSAQTAVVTFGKTLSRSHSAPLCVGTNRLFKRQQGTDRENQVPPVQSTMWQRQRLKRQTSVEVPVRPTVDVFHSFFAIPIHVFGIHWLVSNPAWYPFPDE